MMQGQERTNDLPSPTRSKRGRPNNQDLDVELDNYFRSKRFMTETISKEMEDVAIAEPPITTSPSRSSAMSRYVFSLSSLPLLPLDSHFHHYNVPDLIRNTLVANSLTPAENTIF